MFQLQWKKILKQIKLLAGFLKCNALPKFLVFLNLSKLWSGFIMHSSLLTNSMLFSSRFKWVYNYLFYFISGKQVWLCCGICSPWSEPHLTQGLYDSGLKFGLTIMLQSSKKTLMWPSVLGNLSVIFIDDSLIMFLSHPGTWKLVMFLSYTTLTGVIMIRRYMIHLVMWNFSKYDSGFCELTMFFFCARVNWLMPKLEHGGLTRDSTRQSLPPETYHYLQMVYLTVYLRAWYGSVYFANL